MTAIASSSLQKDKLGIQLFGFMFAFYSSIFAAFIPIFFKQHGFTDVQIGLIISVGTLAGIVQPVFGLLADGKLDIRKVLNVNVTIIAMCFAGLLFGNDYFVVFFLIFVYNLFQAPNYSLIDNVVVRYSIQSQTNFGVTRRYITLGWAISVMLVTPLITKFGGNTFLVICIFGAAMLLFFLNRAKIDFSNERAKDDTAEKGTFKKDLSELVKNKEFILYVIFAATFVSTWSLRQQYQSLLVYEYTQDPLYISIIQFTGILFEVLLATWYAKAKNRIGTKNLYFIQMLLAIVMFLGYGLVDNVILIVIFASIQGVVQAMLVPSLVYAAREIVGSKLSNTAILTINSATSICSFVIASAVLTPVFAMYGIQAVYIALLGLISLTAIPLLFIKIKDEKIAE
ncbi:MFS transporter [Aeromonas media]|uniref:MFS transporter n=1 Tax=Aeromonas media TaxID=651 RepID=UPI002953DBC9|nr:MFS transporter [Aeromonas media]WOQ14073.1 MFS transporter [Aeromonas media]